MKEYLSSMVGKHIKVDRGGPESRSGMLLEVKSDFFTLLTEEDGVVYYNLQHIKSFTRDPKKDHEKAVELPADFNYFSAETFRDILNELKFTWITVNRGGPEKVEGVLISVDNSGISLVLKDEVVNVADFHIRNVSYGNNPLAVEEATKDEAKQEAKQEEKKEEKQSNKKESKQEEKKDAGQEGTIDEKQEG